MTPRVRHPFDKLRAGSERSEGSVFVGEGYINEWNYRKDLKKCD